MKTKFVKVDEVEIEAAMQQYAQLYGIRPNAFFVTPAEGVYFDEEHFEHTVPDNMQERLREEFPELPKQTYGYIGHTKLLLLRRTPPIEPGPYLPRLLYLEYDGRGDDAVSLLLNIKTSINRILKLEDKNCFF